MQSSAVASDATYLVAESSSICAADTQYRDPSDVYWHTVYAAEPPVRSFAIRTRSGDYAVGSTAAKVSIQ